MTSPHPQAFSFYRRRSPPSTPFSASSSSSPSAASSSSFSSFSDMFPDSSSMLLRRAAIVFLTLVFSGLLLYSCTDSLGSLRLSSYSFPSYSLSLSHIVPSFVDTSFKTSSLSEDKVLEKVLSNAAMRDKTVILTTLNEAWADPNSMIDLFLKSFSIGDGTERLLNHLVIVALDQKAFARCQVLHKHCFALVTKDVDFHQEAYFMTPAYLKMMWRRIDFLRSVLEMGYNFVFTDADIMWFRDPFQRFHSDADFQIACDNFLGSSDDMRNRPNGGFTYVKSNNRSIEFYKFWYSSQKTYPGYHDQDVLNFIKLDPFLLNIGLKIKFLDTAYFGGLCEPSRDLNLVCTMHVNCCFGLDNKLHDLKVMLQDWRAFMSLPEELKHPSIVSWRVPQNCSVSSSPRHESHPPENSSEKEGQH